MVKSEIAKLLAVLAASYPKFEVDEIKQQVWYEMLQDIPYQVAQVAVKKLILESPYPPAIADIRKQVAEITTPKGEQLDPAEAWGEVEKAIRHYGSYREEEALASMSPAVAKVAKYMGWREICLSEEPGVVRGQFLKMFSQVQEREKKEALLPEKLKNDIAKIAEKHDLKLIEGGKK
ncbi:replicative helicase loader/inhibitor [Thermoanaerobacterium thermosaccharolyticum]|uniref:replicative helicase loader/inhibitor n=1 Tax=Thermoanaerobacterium thermosaccharolyticum TaxID=1517 RepID=UPI003D2AA5DA